MVLQDPFDSRNHPYQPGEQVGDKGDDDTYAEELPDSSHPDIIYQVLETYHKRQVKDVCTV